MSVRRPAVGRLQDFGLVLLCAGAALWAVVTTVAAPGRVEAAGADLADATVVRRHLAQRMRDATAAVLGRDPASLEVALEPAADRAVDDPRVRAAFATVVGTLARQMLDGETATVTLDVAATTAAMRDALAAVSPADAAALGPAARVEVRLDRPPDLSGAVRALRAAWPLLLGAGAAAVAVGVGLDPRPVRGLGRTGRWLTVLGVLGLLGGVATPLALRSTAGWLGVFGTVVGDGTPLLAPSLGALGLGAGLVASCRQRERTWRRRALGDLPLPVGRWVDTVEG